MTEHKQPNQELSEEELKKVSGGLNGDAIHPRRKAKFSQGQTSFTELSDISRNLTGLKKQSPGKDSNFNEDISGWDTSK